MDLETENRIAAILLKEAAELRRQAQSEGALAYLRQPTVRSRPNSRFLTATVRGVQQANRVVEVNEMWRLREKQLELENKLRGDKVKSNSPNGYRDDSEYRRRHTSRALHEVEASSGASISHSSRKKISQDFLPMEDEGLKDDEVEEFLQSRTKRGRGAVGSRMDETGPYLPSCPDVRENEMASPQEKKARVFLGPEKPFSLKSVEESSDDESLRDKSNKRKSRSSKHKSKGKSKDRQKKKKREEKKKRKHRS